jgi:putative oxidoreductase
MDTGIITKEAVAVLVARAFLGFLFLFQGYDAVFRIGPKRVIETIESPLRQKNIPRALIAAGAYFASYTELIGGVLLVLGLFKYYALGMLGLNLLFASVVFGLIKPMWDMQYVFPRLLLLLFLLLVPAAWDTISIDHLLDLNFKNIFNH